jgi:hypothetical protein
MKKKHQNNQPYKNNGIPILSIPLANVVIPLYFILILCASCSERRIVGRYDSILGTWRTERGIIMSIRMSSGQGAEAAIKIASGFGGKEVETGKVIISSIKPMFEGGFSGLFEMPGNLKPVPVEISLINPDTMLIISRDKRIKGNRMVWRRIENKSDK